MLQALPSPTIVETNICNINNNTNWYNKSIYQRKLKKTQHFWYRLLSPTLALLKLSVAPWPIPHKITVFVGSAIAIQRPAAKYVNQRWKHYRVKLQKSQNIQYMIFYKDCSDHAATAGGCSKSLGVLPMKWQTEMATTKSRRAFL